MSNGGAFDYIVVGSGAGGGTLAARLAEGGRSVLLLEAGGDPRQLSGTNDDQPGINRLPDDYDVPSFHGFASENDAIRWDFFVRHYASDEMQQKDPKYRRDSAGMAGCRWRLRSQRPQCAISGRFRYCCNRRTRGSMISGSRSSGFSISPKQRPIRTTGGWWPKMQWACVTHR